MATTNNSDSNSEFVNPFSRDLTKEWETFYTDHKDVLTTQMGTVQKLRDFRKHLELADNGESNDEMDYATLYLETNAQMRHKYGWVLAPIEGNHRSIALQFGMIASEVNLLSKFGPKLIPGSITRDGFKKAGFQNKNDCTTESIKLAIRNMISSPDSNVATNLSMILRIPRKRLSIEDVTDKHINSRNIIAHMERISEFYQEDKHSSSLTPASVIMSTKLQKLLAMMTKPKELKNKMKNTYAADPTKPLAIFEDPIYDTYLREPNERNMNRAANILSHRDHTNKLWRPPFHLTVQNMVKHDYVTQDEGEQTKWFDVREINALLIIPFIFKPIYERCSDKDKNSFDEVGYRRLKFILQHCIWTTDYQKGTMRKEGQNLGIKPALDLTKDADIHATLFVFELFVAACTFKSSRNTVVSSLARAEQTLLNETHKHIYTVLGKY